MGDLHLSLPSIERPKHLHFNYPSLLTPNLINYLLHINSAEWLSQQPQKKSVEKNQEGFLSPNNSLHITFSFHAFDQQKKEERKRKNKRKKKKKSFSGTVCFLTGTILLVPQWVIAPCLCEPQCDLQPLTLFNAEVWVKLQQDVIHQFRCWVMSLKFIPFIHSSYKFTITAISKTLMANTFISFFSLIKNIWKYPFTKCENTLY